MTPKPNTLSTSSLDWALLHLATDGDTDFLPRPFEIDALTAAKTDVAKEASTIDVSNHVWRGLRNLLIPKDEHSFRAISQLDPLDALLFAAIIREIGDVIERRRIPLSENAVFSYRFNPTPTGHLYGDNSRWDEFWETSEHFALASNFVAITDVTDFYNQVSHHVVENELIAAGVPGYIRTALLNLLKQPTQGEIEVALGQPVQIELRQQPTDFFRAPLERRQQPALEALAQPAHARAPKRDRAVTQAQPSRFPEPITIADRRIDAAAPFIPAARKEPVDFLFQHPLQELLHALPGEGSQCLPGRA